MTCSLGMVQFPDINLSLKARINCGPINLIFKK